MQKIRDLICENRRTNCHRGMASVLQERWSIGHPLQGDTQVRNVRCALVVKPNRGNFDQVRFYTLMTFWPFFGLNPAFLRVLIVFFGRESALISPLVTFWLFVLPLHP